ncbi:ragulator complex LAMTOR4 [Brachionus plicatilis]|uniref:Late endosomal/lysosomal adaptor and MAPK and MTOR activator 4 n=1 Tax=Brachionus plicatilis TaxID=10195 RepID=A0A3M7QZ00_BRAPC|nr:ragulator complex LAMTOR4 [Brachionus plicatilis]
MSDKTPNLEQIPNALGYLVLTDNQITSSWGDLENNEQIANLALRIAYTAVKVPVNPDTNDFFKRISIVVPNQYVFMMTIANKQVYLVKRALK